MTIRTQTPAKRPARTKGPGVGPRNQAQKSPRGSNSPETPNKTTDGEDRLYLLLIDAYIATLRNGLADLQTFYDRLAAGGTSWTGAEAARLADIRKLSNSIRRKE